MPPSGEPDHRPPGPRRRLPEAPPCPRHRGRWYRARRAFSARPMPAQVGRRSQGGRPSPRPPAAGAQRFAVPGPSPWISRTAGADGSPAAATWLGNAVGGDRFGRQRKMCGTCGRLPLRDGIDPGISKPRARAGTLDFRLRATPDRPAMPHNGGEGAKFSTIDFLSIIPPVANPRRSVSAATMACGLLIRPPAHPRRDPTDPLPPGSRRGPRPSPCCSGPF